MPLRLANLLSIVLCLISILSFGCDDNTKASPDGKKTDLPSVEQAGDSLNSKFDPKVTFIFNIISPWREI